MTAFFDRRHMLTDGLSLHGATALPNKLPNVRSIINLWRWLKLELLLPCLWH
jgi:hypothetical protein